MYRWGPLFLIATLGLPPELAAQESELPSADDIARAAEVAREFEAAGLLTIARQQYGYLLLLPAIGRHADVVLDACALEQRAERLERAEHCYLRWASELGPTGLTRARYRAASLRLRRDERGQARLLLQDILHDAHVVPDDRRAWVTLRELVSREYGDCGLARWMQDQTKRWPCADACEGYSRQRLAEAWTEAARLRFEKACDGRKGAEPWSESLEDAFAQARHWSAATAWADDALYWSARFWHAVGQSDRAMQAYRQLINAYESAWFVGSYTSAFLDDAWLGLGELHAQQGDVPEARRIYAKLAAMPQTRLQDTAAYRWACLAPADERVAALRQFVQDFPTSRWRAAAMALGATGDDR